MKEKKSRMMSTDSPFLCAVIKGAPRGTSLDDIVQFLVTHGSEAIHHARAHENANGLKLFFIYHFSTVSAISTVLNFNHIYFGGRNLSVTMHKDSKSDILNLLWENETKKRQVESKSVSTERENPSNDTKCNKSTKMPLDDIMKKEFSELVSS